MFKFLQYFISLILSLAILSGVEGCSDNPTGPSNNSNNTSRDSLILSVDSLTHNPDPYTSILDTTINNINSKELRITFTGITSDTTIDTIHSAAIVLFGLLEPQNIQKFDTALIGRNCNTNFDKIFHLSDSLNYNFRFVTDVWQGNSPTKYIVMKNLKIYKHF